MLCDDMQSHVAAIWICALCKHNHRIYWMYVTHGATFQDIDLHGNFKAWSWQSSLERADLLAIGLCVSHLRGWALLFTGFVQNSRPMLTL